MRVLSYQIAAKFHTMTLENFTILFELTWNDPRMFLGAEHIRLSKDVDWSYKVYCGYFQQCGM